jgi:choline dehydrogenase-like flavoprotein
MYAPWWLYQEAEKLGFPRGYHTEPGGPTRQPPGGGNPVPNSFTRGAYGTKFKEEARRYYGSFIHVGCRGEMIPNENCYAELDPAVRDKWDIPVLRWHWKWADHELNMVRHAQRTYAELFESMGGKLLRPLAENPLEIIDQGGRVIHEVGGAMMGADPAKSVCTQWNQTWDVKNLFVCDGAAFTSNSDKNPTLTIMALAWRAGDYIVEEARKGNL